MVNEDAELIDLQEKLKIISEDVSRVEHSIGEEGFALSNKWYFLFRRAAKSNNNSFKLPISNSHLMQDGHLKVNVIIPQDYIIISKNTWDKIMTWYGGGPEIPITYDVSYTSNKIAPVLPKLYTVIFLDEGEKSNDFFIPSNATVQDLKTEACKFYGINSENTRLLDFFNHHPHDPFEDSAILELLNILPGQEIVLEVQDIRGNWPSYDAKRQPQKVSRGKIGVCGLSNLGNTCFMNSAIQALSHTKEVFNYYCTSAWKKYQNQNKKGVSESFVQVLSAMLDGNRNTFSPIDFRTQVGKLIDSRYVSYQQQDAIEFLMRLVTRLEEESNVSTVKEIAFTGDGTNDEDSAHNCWNNLQEAHKTPIFDMFYGLNMEKFSCPICKKIKTKFYMYFPVEALIPKSKFEKLRIVFIPFDRSKEIKTINAKVPLDATFADFYDSVSSNLSNEHASLAFASKDENNIYQFVEPNKEMQNLVAFEVPDQNKQYFLMQPRSWINDQNGFSSFNLGKPFLVESDGTIPSQQLVERCSQFIYQILFSAKTTNERDITADTFVNNNSELPENECFSIGSVFGEFSNNSTYQSILNATIEVKINGNLVRTSEKFDWSILKDKISPFANDDETINIYDCLDFTFGNNSFVDQSTRLCDYCHETIPIHRTNAIWILPPVLIIHLSRDSKENSMNCFNFKDQTNVEFPNDLDMTKYIQDSQKSQNAKYRLFAVIDHTGPSLFAGHYICYSKLMNSDKWYLFNDSSCTEVPIQRCHTSNAYVLFYELVK